MAAKLCRRLRRFLPPRCLRFFAAAIDSPTPWLSEAAGAFEGTAAALGGAPGFIDEGGALADGPPPGLRGGLGAIAEALRMWNFENQCLGNNERDEAEGGEIEHAQVEGEETRREEFDVELADLCTGDVRGAGNGLAVLPGLTGLEARPWLAARNAPTSHLTTITIKTRAIFCIRSVFTRSSPPRNPVPMLSH